MICTCNLSHVFADACVFDSLPPVKASSQYTEYCLIILDSQDNNLAFSFVTWVCNIFKWQKLVSQNKVICVIEINRNSFFVELCRIDRAYYRKKGNACKSLEKGQKKKTKKKKGKKGQNIWKFWKKCTKFEYILKKGSLMRATLACMKQLEYAMIDTKKICSILFRTCKQEMPN